MYRIAIVDDDSASLKELQDFIIRYSIEQDVEITTNLFFDGEDLLRKPSSSYDIVFLDIEMEHVDGLETARQIRMFDERTIIIFITGFIQYSVRGYSVSAMSFLVKPVKYVDFAAELKRALERIIKNKPTYMCIKTEEGLVQIAIDEITHIETIGRKICIHTTNQNYICRDTMSALEMRLSKKGFFRCHKAYLVNLTHLQKVLDNSAIVADDEVMVSREKRKELMRALLKFASERA